MGSLASSVMMTGGGSGLGVLGSGITSDPGATVVILEEVEDCPCVALLLLDEAGTVAHAVTSEKTTMAAPIAARRLRVRLGLDVPVTVGDIVLLCAIPAPLAAREGSLAME